MNKIIKKTLKIVLPILLGGFILYWVYRDFDFERAKEVLLHGTDWGWMLLSLLFGVMSHVLRGWRWRQTLEPLGWYGGLFPLEAGRKGCVRHGCREVPQVRLRL